VKSLLIVIGSVVVLAGCAGAGYVQPRGGLSNYSRQVGAECYTNADCRSGSYCVANKCSPEQ